MWQQDHDLPPACRHAGKIRSPCATPAALPVTNRPLAPSCIYALLKSLNGTRSEEGGAGNNKHMKTHLAFITAFMVSWSAEAQQPPKTTFDRQGFLREVDAGNIGMLEQVRALPPDDADRILRDVIDHTRLLAPEKAESAAALLGDLPGIPELYDQRLASLPHIHENTRERGLWMSVIEKFHKRWALNLLARYLFDDRPLGTKYTPAEFELFSKEDGFASGSNSSMAASSIAEMCRKENLPTQEKPLFLRIKMLS